MKTADQILRKNTYLNEVARMEMMDTNFVHIVFMRQIMKQTERANKEIQRKLSAEAVARLKSFDKQFSVGRAK